MTSATTPAAASKAGEAAPKPRRLTYLQAIHQAQLEELRHDDSVILMGEDLESNLFGTNKGYVDEFGRERIRDTPISELGFTGAAIGAAMTGLRPIVDYAVATFMYVAMEQLVSQAAKARYMTGGQTSVPAVFRGCEYYGASTAAHHCDRPHSTFMTIPGLKIIAPSNPYDMLGLLKSAVRDDDTVLCFEGLSLWGNRQEVPAEEYLVPLGEAGVKRAGDDVTVVAIGGSVPIALQAAETLAEDGISVEVVDPRTLVPLDWPTILGSIERTGRLVAVDLAAHTCSAASEIIATASEELFTELSAAPVRVTPPDVHIPFAPSMEMPLFPTAETIASAVRKVLG